jgi:CubicO group peptidase (beta-lactamase class C family)
MQIHINRGLHRNGTRIYNASTVDIFYKREDGLPYNNRRALGWDTVPIQTNPPCGTLFSLNSFGHTGYTGTSIWADRDKNLIIVLLTNRVYPTDKSLKIIEARSKISDAIVRTLGLN